MGRTVVVRQSYQQEIRKLDWMEKSILKDSRIQPELKATAIAHIELLRTTLTRVENNLVGAVNVS